MAMQHIRHLFPGSNTAAGFVGFYDDLRGQARRAVILKGGPGVGKSTLMRAVGAHYEKLGEPVLYAACSGDPDSLDAVLAPARGFLILDGTAPHVVDPILPGAADGILNLGVCLNETQLNSQHGEIEALSRAISRRYAQAYRCLRAALALRQDAAAVYDEALGDNEKKRLTRRALSLLPGGAEGAESHFFAQAITCRGTLQQIDSILSDSACCIDAPWGFDVSAVLQAALTHARLHHTARRVYHDPLDASALAHVEIGGLLLTSAVLMDAPCIAPELDQAILRRESQRLAFDKAVYDLTLNQAVEALADAKRLHDSLERYYIDAMDYQRLDEIKAQLLNDLP